jgi:hypothetical protein
VEERTQIHYTIHLGRDHRPSASKLTNFLTQSHRSEQDSNRRGLEVRCLVVWDRCLNHSTTEDLIPNNGTVCSSCRRKSLPGICLIPLGKFQAVSQFPAYCSHVVIIFHILFHFSRCVPISVALRKCWCIQFSNKAQSSVILSHCVLHILNFAFLYCRLNAEFPNVWLPGYLPWHGYSLYLADFLTRGPGDTSLTWVI